MQNRSTLSSMNRLSKNEYMMTAVNCIYDLCSVLASVFVNVYLYSYTGSLVTMAIYTAIRIGMFPIFFTVSGKLAEKWGFSRTLSIGLVFLALQLVEVLALNPWFDRYPALIYLAAVIYGVGESFFWCSINSMNQLVSTLESRSSFVSLMGIFNNLMSIVAPVLSSIIIAASPDDTAGYITIFKVVLVVYMILVILAFQVKATARAQDFKVLRCLKLSDSTPAEHLWKVNSISTFLFGISNSLSLMLSGLLVYNATGGSGSLYSRLLTVFAVLTIISYAYSSKKMKPDKLIYYYTHSAVWTALSTIVLALVPNLFGALFYGISSSLSSAFYWNSYSLIGMQAIGSYEKSENITGRVIARETYLSFGRCTGMFLIVLADWLLPSELYLSVSVTVISLFSIVASQYAKHALQKK